MPGVANVTLPGLALALSMNSFKRVHRRIFRYHDKVRVLAEQRDRDEIGHRIVVQRRVEHRHDRQRRRAEQHGVAVGRRVGRGVVGDVAARAALVLDDDLLAPDFRQPAGGDARGRVGAAAGREADDQPHHAGRPAACAEANRGSAGAATAAAPRRKNSRRGNLMTSFLQSVSSVRPGMARRSMVKRRIDGSGALLHRDQIAQLRARDLAAGLEIFDPAEIVVARLGILLARTGDLDQKLDRFAAVRRVGEPGDALVGGRQNAFGGRQIGGRPASMHGHAGEGNVLHVVGRKAERDEALGGRPGN